jgi:DNA-binding XRE family transcriptional regulator
MSSGTYSLAPEALSQNPQIALGRAIRLSREEADITQEALADTADLDPTSIRGLERGIANPTWDVADRTARALGLALHELARRADELETTDRQPTNQPLRRHD